MTTKFPMTTSGHQALKEELDHLKRVERYAIVNEIEVAVLDRGGHGRRFRRLENGDITSLLT